MTPILPKKGDRFWICPAFFLLAAAPGFWLPVLANILDAKGWGSYTTIAFMVLPLSAIISPLIFSARADQAISAEKLLTVIVGAGAILSGITFFILEQGKHPVLFLLFFGLNSLVTAPAWTLLTTITLSSSDNPGRDFGKFRVWGTLGWMGAGWMVSALSLDLSASVGFLTVGVRVLGAVCCFLLPHSPRKEQPRGISQRSWASKRFAYLRAGTQRCSLSRLFFFPFPLPPISCTRHNSYALWVASRSQQ